MVLSPQVLIGPQSSKSSKISGGTLARMYENGYCQNDQNRLKFVGKTLDRFAILDVFLIT